MVSEKKRVKDMQEHKDSSVALQVAINERKELEKRNKEKKALEEQDKEYAKQTILDEIDNTFKIEKLCEKDSDYAAQVKSELDDEMYAMSVMESEEKNYIRRRKQLDAMTEEDAEIAKKHQEDMDEEQFKIKQAQLQEDFEVARIVQSNVQMHFIRNKEIQERQDRILAHKLLTSSARQLKEMEKKTEIMNSFELWNTESVAAQWEDAEGEIQDVHGGLMITVLLPQLRDLKVGMKNNVVNVNAKRMVMAHEKGANVHNSTYEAEFEIFGDNLALCEKDLKYTYESESGLLHVYVENVHLNKEICNAQNGNSNQDKSNNLMSRIRNSLQRLIKKP